MITGFHRCQSGAVGITFAVAAIPLLLAMGTAIDYNQAYSTKSKLQAIADAAAMAGAAAEEKKAVAENFFQNELKKHPELDGAKSQYRVANGAVTVTATRSVDTIFVRVVGINEIDVKVEATAAAAGGPIELVIALDATTSMSSVGSRQQAYDAITQVIGQVFDNSANGEAFATLMPFSDRVMIPMSKESWCTTASSRMTGTTS